MNYDPKTSFQEAIRKEQQFDNLFKTIQSLINMNKALVKDTNQNWTKAEFDLSDFLTK